VTDIRNLRMPSRVLGQDVLHSLYLPPGHGTSGSGSSDSSDSSRSYPLLFLLHGGGDDDSTSWLRDGNAEAILDEAIAQRRIPPMVVAMPDARRDASKPQPEQDATYYINDADGAFRYADMFIEEFVPYIESRYHAGGSASRRAIGGLSMGGFGAMSFALRQQGMFGSAFGLSTAHRTDEQFAAFDMADYNRRYARAFGADLAGEARLNRLYRDWNLLDSIARTPAETLSRTAYFLDCGAYDEFFEGNADLHVALTRKNVPHRFMAREGQHEWPYWISGLPAALDFVAEHLD
jgi:S-formylglutathione hydrolase FrmB